MQFRLDPFGSCIRPKLDGDGNPDRGPGGAAFILSRFDAVNGVNQFNRLGKLCVGEFHAGPDEISG